MTIESEREGEPMSQLAKTSGIGAGGSSFTTGGAGEGATLSLSDSDDSSTDAMDVVDECAESSGSSSGEGQARRVAAAFLCDVTLEGVGGGESCGGGAAGGTTSVGRVGLALLGLGSSFFGLMSTFSSGEMDSVGATSGTGGSKDSAGRKVRAPNPAEKSGEKKE